MGRIEVYESLVASTNPNRGLLLLLPDGFGHVTHNFILADEFAKEGWHVVVPDYYEGHLSVEEQPWPEEDKQKLRDLDFPGWLRRHNHEHVSILLNELMDHLSQKHLNVKIAGVGYCFGGKHVLRLAKTFLTVAVAFHPSFVEAEDMNNIKVPLYVGLAADDDMVPANLAADIQEWSTTRMKGGVSLTLETYPDVGHGFAARPDTEDANVREQYNRALRRTIEFLIKNT
ncbi:alpha/beta-hydrolase [Plenodomus tracheiphilus IPT5]|uniref:Alpha/beta-hydrolase n=1 Tax=Plenodomus tracheiphilus IPT5 TaxID=1408161 RepID=A0A6A7AU98_9PLEO|nr:alpha/beta-hydrolase [Plenodomus tracheiphilus IPT5]